MADILNLYSLNVRGLQGMSKRKQVLNWLKRYNKGIILLQETHTSFKDEIWFEKCWESTVFFSHGSTNAKGVCILIPKTIKANCTLHYRDTDGRILIVKIALEDTEYFVCNVYSPVSSHEKDQLTFLKNLTDELVPIKNNNLLLGGDWNVVLNPNMDKKGGNKEGNKNKYRDLLKNVIEDFELTDSWRLYHPNKKRYTWFQHHPPVFCRLDMWLISESLLNILSYCKIESGFKTDHSLILFIFEHSKIEERERFMEV